MADIASWSPIDDNNNAAPPHGWPEGQMPSTANNCARAMMGGVRRWYDTVTAQIASITASLGNYLPLGGGHLTGPVTSASSFAASGNLSGWDITAGGTVATQYVNASATVAAGQYNLRGTPFANSDGATLHIYDATGGGAIHLQAATNYYDADTHAFRTNAGGNTAIIDSGGNLILTGNYVHFSGSTGTVNTTGGPMLYADNNNHVYKQGSGNGAWLFQNYAGTNVATINASGALFASSVHSTGNVQADGTFTGGAVSVGGAVTGNYVHSTGNIDAGTYAYAPDGFWAHDAGGGTTYRMYSSGGSSYLQFANFYAFRWDAGSGSLNYIASADIQWVMRTGDFLTYNALAAVGGIGAYINLSDRRGKTDIVPSTRGLDEILRLSPVEFKRVSRVAGQVGMDRRELGFIAQDVQGVLPEAVRIVGMTLPDGTGGLEDAEPSLGITDSTIVAALVGAVKTLNARIATLEEARHE